MSIFLGYQNKVLNSLYKQKTSKTQFYRMKGGDGWNVNGYATLRLHHKPIRADSFQHVKNSHEASDRTSHTQFNLNQSKSKVSPMKRGTGTVLLMMYQNLQWSEF